MSISLPGTSSTPFGGALSLSSGKVDKPLEAKTAEQKFLDYAQMTPAQRMFSAMLGQLGITPDQFQSMDADAQREVTQKIQQMMEQQAQNGGNRDPGQIADITV